MYYENGWSDWESLGGKLTSSPAVASDGKGRLNVFYRGTDMKLYHTAYSNKKWHSHEKLYNFIMTSGPSVTSYHRNRLDVFARGKDKNLWQITYYKGWNPWIRVVDSQYQESS